MNKMIAIFIVASFAISMLPILSVADMDERPEARVSNAPNIKPVTTATQTGVGVCADYMRKNDFSDTPIETCKRIMSHDFDCIETLTDLGVEEPKIICKRFMQRTAKIIKTRAYVAEKVTRAISEWKLKRADGMIERNPATKNVLLALSEEKQKVFLHMARAQQEDIVRKGKDAAMAALEKLKLQKMDKNMVAKKRLIVADKLDQARRRFENAKEQYQKLNDVYEKKKNQFLETKKMLLECTDDESSECVQLRKQIMEHAKEFIGNGIERAVQHLEKVKAKIESAEGLDETEAADILAEIDEFIASLEGIADDLESAETKEDVRDAANELDKAWKTIRVREHVHTAKLFKSSVWGIIKTSEHLEERLESALANLLENGIDTTEIDSKVSEFSAKILSAKEKIEQSEELLRQAHEMRTTSGNDTKRTEINDIAKQGKDLAKEAYNEIKEAHTLLVEIVRMIKDAGGNVEEPESDEGLTEDETYEVVEDNGDE